MTAPATVISIKTATTTVEELKVIRGLIDSLIADKLDDEVRSEIRIAGYWLDKGIRTQEGLAK